MVDIPLTCHAISDADRSKEQEEGDAMRCKCCNKVITDLPEYCQECDRAVMREIFADGKDFIMAMAKLAEIKDLPAHRCREELRRFVAVHNGGA